MVRRPRRRHARNTRALCTVGLLLDLADAKASHVASRPGRHFGGPQQGIASGRLDQAGVRDLTSRLRDIMNPSVPMPALAGKPGVLVRFDLAMNKLLSFDMTAGLLECSVYYRLFWNDDRLKYNGTEVFGDAWVPSASYVVMDDWMIWKPDVVPYYSSAYTFQTHGCGIYDSTFLKENGWNVMWSRPGRLTVHCDTRLQEFPFDTQECSIVVGPWLDRTYDFRALFSGISSNAFPGNFDSEEWEVTRTTISSKAQRYINGVFPEVHYTMAFRRFPHFYMVNAVLPMALVVILSLLALWLPIDHGSGERLGFAVTLLLTIMATAIFTANFRPATREDTWLDRFQAYCILLTFLPVLESVLVVWLQYIYEKVGSENVVSEGDEVVCASSTTNSADSFANSRFSLAKLARGGNDHLIRSSQKALQATFGMRMVVFLMHKLPSIEWLVTGTRTSSRMTPRDIDTLCRHVLSVVVLVAAGKVVADMPGEWMTGTSVHIVMPPICMGLALYAVTGIGAVVILLLRIAILCKERRERGRENLWAGEVGQETAVAPPECAGAATEVSEEVVASY